MKKHRLIPQAFESQYFVGGHAKFRYDTRNNAFNPTRGLVFNTEVQARRLLSEELAEDWLVQFRINASIYQRLVSSGRLVLATRLDYQYNYGDYFFYQAPTLGGFTSLRGFRINRFAGDWTFSQSTDLRLKGFSVKNRILPFDLGFFAAGDYGRVWVRNDNSDIWHSSFGGGIYLQIFDSFVISVGYHQATDNNRILIDAGFNF